MKLKEIKSISDLYYVIGDWFTILMFSIVIWTLPISLFLWDNVISFIMCAALAFVGAAPHFRLKSERKLHYGAAIISAIGSFIWTLYVYPIALSILMAFCIISIIDKTRWMLWAELGCFIMIFSCFFILLI